MVSFLKVCTLLVLCLAMTGCNEKQSYSYLMRHPGFLHREEMRCNNMTQKTSAQAAQCAEVKRAATDFMTLASEQQTDPEGFGKRVMRAENECVDAKKQLVEARQQLTSSPGQEAEKKVEVAKKRYREKRETVGMFLAVIGIHSPE